MPHHKYLLDPKNAPKAASFDAVTGILSPFKVYPLLIGRREFLRRPLSDRDVIDYIAGGLTDTKTIEPGHVATEAWPGNRDGHLQLLSEGNGSVILDVCTGVSRRLDYSLKTEGKVSTKHLFAYEVARIFKGRKNLQALAIYQDLNGANLSNLIEKTIAALVRTCNAAGAVVHSLEEIQNRRGFAIIYLPKTASIRTSLHDALRLKASRFPFEVSALDENGNNLESANSRIKPQ